MVTFKVPVILYPQGKSLTIMYALMNQMNQEEKGNLESFRIDNFCTVNPVPEHRKKYVFRAMLSGQRSFLLRAETENEMNKWIESLRLIIGKKC